MAKTSIAAGASVTVTVPAGSRVEIIGSGTYEARPSTASSRPTVVQDIADAGSWIDASPTDGSVTIIASGAGASYEVSSASDVLDPGGNVSLTASQVAGVLAALPATALWANRAALVTAGQYTAFFTDVGVGGSVWTYSGGRWRPYLGRVRLKSLVTDVSNSAAPKIVLDYATLPAGIWQDGDTLECCIVKERTGGTSDTDATDVMLGTAPTTLGTTLNLSTSAMATTSISLSLMFKWRRISATSVRSQSVAGAVGLGTATAANSLITGLSNLGSVETYLQVTSDLTTAGGEASWLRGFTVDLVAGS